MSEASRRFWTETRITPGAEGYTLQLDGRAVRTPAKTPLRIPTEALAEALRAEWEAQGELVDPATMPLTRYANSAIDNVAPNFEGVVDVVAAYGGSDLLCYRAGHPAGLVARQAQAWDPVLGWARAEFDAPLILAEGVIHVAQPEESLARLRDAVAARSALSLCALHDLTALSGSLLLALAVERRHLSPEAAWDASRIDERWQAEQWGEDDDAAAQAALKRRDFLTAASLLDLLATDDAAASPGSGSG